VNLTYPTTLVLQSLAHGFHYGFDVIDATGLPSGTVYPILRRLKREALVSASWEDVEIAQRERRPPRRYYELTAAGDAVLETALTRYRVPREIAARARRLRPARST
jgi:PadR family transcriptional regulator, regulatory protein PadR